MSESGFYLGFARAGSDFSADKGVETGLAADLEHRRFLLGRHKKHHADAHIEYAVCFFIRDIAGFHNQAEDRRGIFNGRFAERSSCQNQKYN